MSRWLVVVVLASCGRFGFGDTPPAIDAHETIDTITDTSITSLIHQYPLTSDFADALGGPALSPHGGSVGTAGYQFGVNEGLTVANAMPLAVYTIDLRFQLDAVSGYRKVIDFKGLGSDAGLYIEDSRLQFVVVPVTGCPGSDCFTSGALYTAGQSIELTLTRDAAGLVIAYLDRAAQFSFTDQGNVGTFDTTGDALALFIDDTSTMTEASSGMTSNVRIYSTALTADQVTGQ